MAVWRKCLLTMYNSHVFFTKIMNTLLTQDVKASRRKWDGIEVSAAAFACPVDAQCPPFRLQGQTGLSSSS